MKFMRSLLKGDKRVRLQLITNNRWSNLQSWRASIILIIMKFSVDKIWIKFKDDKEFTKYFPDFKENQRPEKKFLLNLLATLKPYYAKAMIQKSHQNRKEEDAIEKSEVIQITPQLLAEIKDSKFSSSKIAFIIL